MRKLNVSKTPRTDQKLQKLEKPKKDSKKTPRTKKKPKKKIYKYKRMQCAFVDENGVRCTSKAVGKSTLCKKHGGSKYIPENMIKDDLVGIGSIGTKYNPEVHPLLYIQLSREGYSNPEIAAEFQISSYTLQQWTEKYESFYLAAEIGKEMQEAWWLRKGKDNLENNRNFNTNLFKYLTMNKLGYSDKIESKSTNLNVHGVLMVPDAVSEDEWEKDIIDVNS